MLCAVSSEDRSIPDLILFSEILWFNIVLLRAVYAFLLSFVQNRGYHNLKPAGWVREDYHIFQGTRGEYFHGMQARLNTILDSNCSSSCSYIM